MTSKRNIRENRSEGSWAYQSEGRQRGLRKRDLGIFGPGTKAEGKSQRKPAEGGCGAKMTKIEEIQRAQCPGRQRRIRC